MKIKELKNDRQVILNDKWIIGGIILKERCPICNNRLIYNDKYDCNFCPECNEWSTQKCQDPECCYCRTRPETPLHEFY